MPLPFSLDLCCFVLAAAAFPLLVQAAPLNPTPVVRPDVPNPVQTLIEHYSADHDTLAHFYSDPLSPTTRERMRSFLASSRQQLSVVDFAALDQEGKADYLLQANHLTREEHDLALAAAQWKAVEPFLPVAPALFALEDAKRRLELPIGEKVAGQLSAMTAALTARRKELEDGMKNEAAARPSRIAAWRAADDLDQLRDQLHLSGLSFITDTTPASPGGPPSPINKPTAR